jgi:hypothetical protein
LVKWLAWKVLASGHNPQSGSLELKAQSLKLLKVKSFLTGYSKGSLKPSWLLSQSKVISYGRSLNIAINQKHSGFLSCKLKGNVYSHCGFAGRTMWTGHGYNNWGRACFWRNPGGY